MSSQQHGPPPQPLRSLPPTELGSRVRVVPPPTVGSDGESVGDVVNGIHLHVRRRG